MPSAAAPPSGGSQAGWVLTWFHMPSIAFQTDDALVSDSLSTCTCRRAGHATALILLAIQTALGGSMKSRLGQRQVGSEVASSKATSSASMACGCIGPLRTVVMWLRTVG